MSQMQQVILDSNNVVEIRGLYNSVDQAYVNDATLSCTIKDAAGTEVSGEIWPKSMPYVAASNGLYRATLADTLGVNAGEWYHLEVVATTPTSQKRKWVVPLKAHYDTVY